MKKAHLPWSQMSDDRDQQLEPTDIRDPSSGIHERPVARYLGATRYWIVGLALVLCVALVLPVRAEEWGAIVPGKTVKSQVRERFGPPSREETKKVDTYNTAEWLYEHARAPRGIRQMQVQFGLLTPQGFNPDIVRALTLNPRPGVFTRVHILTGWGQPDQVGTDQEKGQRIFLYKSGLAVLFDTNEQLAETLLFTPPQSDGTSK